MTSAPKRQSPATPSSEGNETQRVRAIYERTASTYDRAIGLVERLLLAGGRQRLCGEATGDVLEIAVGTGRNIPYYSTDIRLTGIDISPAMLAFARERAAMLGRTVDLQIADAQALPFPDDAFDTVVSTLTLCTIPDERRAIIEAQRVLRPGGHLLLLEHVRSPILPVRLGQQLIEPLSIRLQADHLLREPHDAVATAGLVIDRCERSKWGIIERLTAHKQDQ